SLFGKYGSYVAQLAQRRDHWKHDADLAERRGAQDRPQLGPQDLRTIEAHPDAALPKKGIVLLGNGQVGERLVASHVESPDDEGAVTTDGFGYGSVSLELLLLGRRIGALHEEKFGAQQAD